MAEFKNHPTAAASVLVDEWRKVSPAQRAHLRNMRRYLHQQWPDLYNAIVDLHRAAEPVVREKE